MDWNNHVELEVIVCIGGMFGVSSVLWVMGLSTEGGKRVSHSIWSRRRELFLAAEAIQVFRGHAIFLLFGGFGVAVLPKLNNPSCWICSMHGVMEHSSQQQTNKTIAFDCAYHWNQHEDDDDSQTFSVFIMATLEKGL